MIPPQSKARRSIAATRPNILWIFSEDLSPYIGCYGDPVNSGHTPAIDRFAAQGVLFKHAYATAPVCSASRSAIITGVMQTTTGTHHHRSSRAPEGVVVPPETRIHLPQEMKTVPELMRDAGYFTFNNGKDDYNFHYDRRALYTLGTQPDYTIGMNGWQGNHAHHFLSLERDTWSARPDKDQPWFGQVQIMGGKAYAQHTRDGEVLEASQVPLPPYFPDTPGHRESWTAHYNAVRGADAQIEEILDRLAADGEIENTIVFFFSDHGNNQSLRHKQFCYEGGVHIPLMVAGDHPSLKPGTVRDDLVSGLDISATTLALASVDRPSYLDGNDLFDPATPARGHVISARDRCDFTFDRIRTVRSALYRYIRNDCPERAMLQAQYRDGETTVKDLKRLHAKGELTAYQAKHWFGRRPAEELYDLARDPYQIENLAEVSSMHGVLKRHRKTLEDWIASTGDRGADPEHPTQLEATYLWWKNEPAFKNAKTAPEFRRFET